MGAYVKAFWRTAAAAAAIVAALGGTASAQDKDPRTAAALQDNSFLIEEAYNQEPGVVQHILGIRRQGRDWDFVFTQEWPIFSQTHQFSYSIPYSRLRSDGQRANGLGDIFLNYRLQVLNESATMPAFAPRISLILPTGNELKGLGDGSYGTQINLPFSKIVSDRVTLHFNAGYTQLFDVQSQDLRTYTIGGSVVYAFSRELNVLLEGVAERADMLDDVGARFRQNSFTISPGVRAAINAKEGQYVFGLGAPIVFTENAPTSYGAIIYLSFEHSFLKTKK